MFNLVYDMKIEEIALHFLLNKTLREDAHIVQRKVAIATAQWRAKRSKSLMSEGNREPQRTCPLCSNRLYI